MNCNIIIYIFKINRYAVDKTENTTFYLTSMTLVFRYFSIFFFLILSDFNKNFLLNDSNIQKFKYRIKIKKYK